MFVLVIAMMLLSGCEITNIIDNFTMNPKKILKDSQLKMREVKTIRMDGKSTFKVKLIGNSYIYTVKNKSQTHLSKGKPIEAIMDTSLSGTGLMDTNEKFYFNNSGFAKFDPNSSKWDYNSFNMEDRFLIDIFLSSYDPSNSFNQHFDSFIKSDIEIIGRKEIDGNKCVGLFIKTNADELMEQYSGIFKGFAGSAGEFATSITGSLVKNLEQTVWIGLDDKLVHQIDMNLPMLIGKYHSSAYFYDYNQPFEIQAIE